MVIQMSNEQKPGYLVDVGDYTTQFYKDYNQPMKGSRHEPIRIQWKVKPCFFFVAPMFVLMMFKNDVNLAKH